MWARLFLVVSLFTEGRGMVEGRQKKTERLVGPWALVGRALMGQAFVGRALMGQALKGRALYGPDCYWPHWALVGQALIGLPGPSWAGP